MPTLACVKVPCVVLVLAALAAAALFGAATPATAVPSSCAGADGSGYTYAGHQAAFRGSGVRATITPQRGPRVPAGHVAAWVGVGGPGQGANGADAWIQAGIASMPGLGLMSYVEITQPGRSPRLEIVEHGLAVGRSVDVSVVEARGLPGHWQALVDGRAVGTPVRLAGSSGRWAPIATAESWNGGQRGCNSFAFRFEGVALTRTAGRAWQPFVSGHRFLDSGNRLRSLSTSAGDARALSSRGARQYAFVASSGSS